MESTGATAATGTLREVDALARAAHLWVRQQETEHRFLGVLLSGGEQQALAAGFLAGMRGVLSLEDQEAALVAYAYFLMRGAGNAAAQATELTGEVIDFCTRMPVVSDGYEQGRQAARDLLSEPGRLI